MYSRLVTFLHSPWQDFQHACSTHETTRQLPARIQEVIVCCNRISYVVAASSIPLPNGLCFLPFGIVSEKITFLFPSTGIISLLANWNLWKMIFFDDDMSCFWRELLIIFAYILASLFILKHYATNRKVAGSIPDVIFKIYLILPAALGPGVYSAS
jgi:hypothetical protein